MKTTDLTPKVGVVYLARVNHGIDGFRPFVDSYREFPAGYPHELIVLGKGMTDAKDKAATSALFDGIPHNLIEISDDGFDIHAYLKVAKLLDHDFLFFCNTYTEFAAVNWLKIMVNLVQRPNVGVIGTTASYESLYDSMTLYNKLSWLVTVKQVKYDSSIARQYRDWLEAHAPRWIEPSRSMSERLRAFLERIRPRNYVCSQELENEFADFWRRLKDAHEGWRAFEEFESFPNPHIRSTSFLISRKLLLDLNFELPETKIACALFESGPDGLSRKLLDKGLDLIVAGADGRGYYVEEWPTSETFRLGRQGNSLTRDNHTRGYDKFRRENRELHARLAWGDYLGPAPANFVSLGTTLPKIIAQRNERLAIIRKEKLSYSIVIPTHNRLELVKDAIETVRRQSYTSWELVVYDNASTEPLSAYIDSLADPRIRFKRSERFLPVTESWNNAIDEATGDYVMLFGDDDGLKPGFFERVERLNRQFRQPDVIYSSILQFFHPGVAPWQPEGYVSEVRNGFFFVDQHLPFELDMDSRHRAVAGSLGIRRNFTFNMQAFVFKRAFLDRIRSNGRVFKPPFPDYYLANVAFALADKVVVDPTSLAIAGVSRASFGFTLFNGQEKKGAELLNSDFDSDPVFNSLKHKLLPGTAYYSNYIITMDHVAKRLGGRASKVQADISRYRRMQILHLIKSSEKGMEWLKSEAGAVAWKRLSPREKWWAYRVSRDRDRPGEGQEFVANVTKKMDPTEFNALIDPKNVGGFRSTMELFKAIERSDI